MDKSLIRNIIICFCWLLILIPATFVSWRLAVYYAEDQTAENVANMVAEYTIREPGIIKETGESIGLSNFIDISALKATNPDTIGYIQVEGTPIAYPVMKTEMDNQYLRRNFFGDYSLNGSIYMDNACYDTGTNRILYGHNMKNGSMFGTLKGYLKPGFWDEHKEIQYIQDGEIQKYEVIAAFVASASDQDLIQNLIPYTEDEFMNLFSYMKNHQGMIWGEAIWGDTLITLATCEYSKKDGRLFVIGKKINSIIRKK